MKFVTVQERKIRKKLWIVLLIVALIAVIFIAFGIWQIYKDIPRETVVEEITTEETF